MSSPQQSDGARRVAPAGDRDRLERNGDRRPRAAPPRRDAARTPKNTVLFVGYQAAGTRGRLLVDGAKAVKIMGHDLSGGRARSRRSTRCRRTPTASEIMRWLSGFTRPPAMTYLVHGDPVALDRARGARDHARSSGPCTSPRIWNASRLRRGWDSVEVRSCQLTTADSTDDDAALPATTRRAPHRPTIICSSGSAKRRWCRSTPTASRDLPLARQDADLASVSGGDRRPRHLLRPALRAQPRDARRARGDPHARRDGVDPIDARGDPRATPSCSGSTPVPTTT